MKRFLMPVTALLLAGSFLAACGDDDDDNPAVEEDSSNTTMTVGNTNADESGGLTLLATDTFSFNPSTLNAPAGAITITLRNGADSIEHNLTIEELDVDKDVEAGETEKVDIEDAAPGVYPFFCEYHPNSMKGTLTVT